MKSHHIDSLFGMSDYVVAMSEISDTQILQALRDKATFYAKMAKDFEKQMGNGHSSQPVKFSLEAVQDYLRQKAARPADLAKHFRVHEREVRALLANPGSKVSVVGRGWLKLEE